MVGGMITLASYGFFGGTAVGNFLSNLETVGFFSYVLPFMMIFAIVYAILSKSHLLGNKDGVNIILSLAVSLMALQFNFVSYFFSEIFPRMGILLSVILVAIILLSLFLDFDKKGTKFIIGFIAFVGFILILFQSFGDAFGFGFYYGFPFNGAFGWWLQQNLPWIFVVIFVFAGIAWSISKGKKDGPKKKLNLADLFSSDSKN